MTKIEQHHDLAMMLLVARSLPEGLPWSIEQDQEHIRQEHLLWSELSPTEQEIEQLALFGLWQQKDRAIKADPSWGDWAKDLGEVSIPDRAFGPSNSEFRPESIAPPDPQDYPGFEKVVHWLFQHGFRVTRIVSDSCLRKSVLHMPIPPHRIDKEADRLSALLGREFPNIRQVPPDWVEKGACITASYDATTTLAFLYLQGVSNSSLHR